MDHHLLVIARCKYSIPIQFIFKILIEYIVQIRKNGRGVYSLIKPDPIPNICRPLNKFLIVGDDI